MSLSQCFGAGAETFGQSWSQYSELLAPGQTKVVYKNHISY